MKKGLCFTILCTLLLTGFLGCSLEPSLPRGVRETTDGYRYYAIEFRGEEDALDYFTKVGLETQVSVQFSDGYSYMNNAGVVRYSKVEEGGWIAYKGYAKVLYFPENFPAARVKAFCSGIAKESDNFMSIEEAKAYIPGLND